MNDQKEKKCEDCNDKHSENVTCDWRSGHKGSFLKVCYSLSLQSDCSWDGYQNQNYISNQKLIFNGVHENPKYAYLNIWKIFLVFCTYTHRQKNCVLKYDTQKKLHWDEMIKP